MKSKLIIFLIAFIFASCKSFKEYSNQEYVLKENSKQNFIYSSNKPLLEVSINNHKGLFLFDTGATTSIITDSIFLNSIKTTTNLKKSTSIKNASGLQIQGYKILTNQITSDLFDSKNILFSYYKVDENKLTINNCFANNENNSRIGILGMNHFMQSEKTIALNFDENTIQVVEDSFDKTDFIELKAELKITRKKIIIPLEINHKTIEFLFDTGNSGGLFTKDGEISETIPAEEGEMLLGNFDSFSTQTIKYFKNLNISNFPISIENQNITSFNPFHTNSMGMKFISKFNWIIDFKNKKVYIKKNKNNFESNAVQNNSLQVAAINGELIIGFKNKSVQNFNIGDKIDSVNQEKVTSENICKMAELLNKTPDWNTLKIEIKK